MNDLQPVTDRAAITIANKYKVAQRLLIGILIFYQDPFKVEGRCHAPISTVNTRNRYC